MNREEIIKTITRRVTKCEAAGGMTCAAGPIACREVLALINDQEAEIETEGGGSSWWHVCGECRGLVDTQDRYCRHCGSKLKQ